MATTNSCYSGCSPAFPENVTITNTTNTVNVAGSEGQWRRERIPIVGNQGVLEYTPMLNSMTIDKNGQILPYPDCWNVNGLIVTFGDGVVDSDDIVSITYLTLDTPPATIAEVGTIATFSTTTPPSGWLKCDGAAVRQATYSALYLVILHTYRNDAPDEAALNALAEPAFRLPNLDTSFYDGSTLVTLDSMIKH